jgi:hypothetical protein
VLSGNVAKSCLLLRGNQRASARLTSADFVTAWRNTTGGGVFTECCAVTSQYNSSYSARDQQSLHSTFAGESSYPIRDQGELSSEQSRRHFTKISGASNSNSEEETSCQCKEWLVIKIFSLLAPVLTVSSLVDILILPSTLKMEAIRSSETSANTTYTRCHIPEDCFLHSHRSENLKSYIKIFVQIREPTQFLVALPSKHATILYKSIFFLQNKCLKI